MTSFIDQNFSKLYNIYTSPESYITIKKENISELTSESIQRQLINQFKNIKSVDGIDDDIDDNTVAEISNIFNNIFKSIDIKVDFSKFKTYLQYYLTLPQTQCSHFVDASTMCDNFRDDDIIPIDIFFKSISCKSCGFFKETHNVCSKYEPVNPDNMFCDCIKCGLSKYDHKICDKFCFNINYNSDVCVQCGRDLHSHRDKEIKNGIRPCRNFLETDKTNKRECKNCIHSRTYHMLNPLLFEMNEKSFSEFTDLSFKFNADYSILNDNEKRVKINKFYDVVRMNYSTNYSTNY